jgi:ABC-type phosphate transport system substrate-binding protein
LNKTGLDEKQIREIAKEEVQKWYVENVAKPGIEAHIRAAAVIQKKAEGHGT